jgi:hypothetical protein
VNIDCKTKRMKFGPSNLSNLAGPEGDLTELPKAIPQHHNNTDYVRTGRTQWSVASVPMFMAVSRLESWHLMSATYAGKWRTRSPTGCKTASDD